LENIRLLLFYYRIYLYIMADTTIYNQDKLAKMKLNNDDYLANKAMYKELQQIKLLVLGQNN